jgi:hypothetical protein
MPAYNFKHRFVPQIIAGLEPGPWVPGMKRHTIRTPRKRQTRVGETIQLQTGPRFTPHRIGSARIVAVIPIDVGFLGDEFVVGRIFQQHDGRCHELEENWSALVAAPLIPVAEYIAVVTGAELDAFARADGFADAADMRAFWDLDRPRDACRPEDGGFAMEIVAWVP